MIPEAVRQALRILWAHKLRSGLTMFGVVWGTATVIFLVSWGTGVQMVFEEAFFKAGKNMGEVWAGRVSEEFTPAVDRRYLWYTLDDLEVLRRRARLPLLVGGESWRLLPVAFGQHRDFFARHNQISFVKTSPPPPGWWRLEGGFHEKVQEPE